LLYSSLAGNGLEHNRAVFVLFWFITQLKRQLTDHPVHGGCPLCADGVVLAELRQSLQDSLSTAADYRAKADAANVRIYALCFLASVYHPMLPLRRLVLSS
jgi:hypothetical protein